MTLVLSQLTLNLSQRDVRRDLGNAYDMHRTLAKAFADGPTSKVRPFLWRLEPSRSAESPPASGAVGERSRLECSSIGLPAASGPAFMDTRGCST